MDFLKAVMLVPVAFVGMSSALIFEFPPVTLGQAITNYGMLAAFHLAIAGVLVWTLSRPSQRFLGHSWITWAVLMAIAYTAGLSIWLAI